MERFNFISEYLAKTPFLRKMADALLVASLILVWGFASGKIHLPTPEPHTVKASFDASRQIQKVLDIEQNQSSMNFVGHFNFHNGTQGLSGFNFMKYSLTEYSSKLGINVPVEELQNIPIVSNMKMVGALVDSQCYSSTPTPNSSRYRVALAMNVQSYTACPVTDYRNALIGFVVFGSNNIIPPNEAEVREAAKQVKTLHIK